MAWALGLLAAGLASNAALPRGRGDSRLDGVATFPWSNLATLLVPDHTVYNSTDAIHSKIEALMSTCKELTHLTSAAALRSASINETRVLQLTSVAPTTKNKTTILITFGIHGREYIASEVGLAMIYKLCDGSDRSAKVLQHTRFVIFPVMNVAGRKKMGTGMGKDSSPYTCSEMRKNGNNVDLNRNFDVMWADGSDDPTAEDYRGPSPNSEAEAILLDGVARAAKPHVYVDVHSGDMTMMFPYSYQALSCVDATAQQTLADYAGESAFGCSKEMMNYASRAAVLAAGPGAGAGGGVDNFVRELEALTNCPRVGNAAETLSPPYVASGTTLDYAYEVWKVPYPYTWEVFSGLRAAQARKASAAAQELTSTHGAAAHGTELLARPAGMDAVKPHPAIAAQHRRGTGHGAQQHVLLPGSAGMHATSLLEGFGTEMTMSECFAYFNPTSADAMAETTDAWSKAMIAVAEHFIS